MSHVSPKQVFPLAKNWSNIYKRLTQEPNYRWQHNHPHQKTQEEGRQRRTLIKTKRRGRMVNRMVNQQFLKILYSSSITTRYLLPISTKLSDPPPGSTKTLLRLLTNVPLKVIIVLISKSKQFLKSPAFHKEKKRGKNKKQLTWCMTVSPPAETPRHQPR